MCEGSKSRVTRLVLSALEDGHKAWISQLAPSFRARPSEVPGACSLAALNGTAPSSEP